MKARYPLFPLLVICSLHLFYGSSVTEAQILGYYYEGNFGTSVSSPPDPIIYAVGHHSTNGGKVLFCEAPGPSLTWYYSTDTGKSYTPLQAPTTLNNGLSLFRIEQIIHLYDDYYFVLAWTGQEPLSQGFVPAAASTTLLVRVHQPGDSLTFVQQHTEGYISVGPTSNARNTFTRFTKLGDTLVAFRRPLYDFGNGLMNTMYKVYYTIDYANNRLLGDNINTQAPRIAKTMNLEYWNTLSNRGHRVFAASFSAWDKAAIAVSWNQFPVNGVSFANGDVWVLRGAAPNDTLARTNYDDNFSRTPLDIAIVGNGIALGDNQGRIIYSTDYGSTFAKRREDGPIIWGTVNRIVAREGLVVAVTNPPAVFIDTAGIDTNSTIPFWDDVLVLPPQGGIYNSNNGMKDISIHNRSLFMISGTRSILGRFYNPNFDTTSGPACPTQVSLTLGSSVQIRVPTPPAGFNNVLVSWEDCNTNQTLITNSTTLGFTPNANGSYRAIINYAPGCTVTTNCFLFNGFPTSVDPNLQSAFSLYPNPVADVLHLSFSTPAERSLTLVNTRGEVVRSLNLPANLTHEVNVADLPAGLYLARMGAHTVRFVRQ